MNGKFRIVEAGERDRWSLIEQLKSDLLHNLFVVYSLLHEPEKTLTYVVYDKSGAIRAHLLLYGAPARPMARLDGEKEPASRLLGSVRHDKMILFCPPSLVGLVKRRFPSAFCYPEHQMYVAEGEERLAETGQTRRLEVEEASLLAELYSCGGQRFAFRRSPKRCRELLEKHHVYGVFEDDRLVSVAAAVKRLPEVGEITGVLTHPNYRRRGFGTLSTSAATEDVLLHAAGANLYVGADNRPAVKMYEKIGYKKIDDWYWIDIGTGTRP